MRLKNKKQNGFALLEILVAVSIITLTIFSVTAFAQKSISISRGSLRQAQASFLLEEGAEAVKIIRDNGWANISALALETPYYLEFSGGTWSLSATSNMTDIFTRTVTFSSVNRDSADDIAESGGTLDPRTKKVTVIVSWQDGGAISKNLIFYLADIFS